MSFEAPWFSDGLLKIAEVANVSSVEDLKKTLQPGDILYTKPRKNDGLLHKAFYALESAIQGSPYTHVGLYVGNNKIVDAGEWKTNNKATDTAVHSVDLDTFTDRYNFKVLRVAASKKVKEDAVAYAKKQLGKDFNFPGMFRLVLPFQGSPEKKDRLRKDLADSFFCSELVANAYSPVNIAANKALKHIMPGDISRSHLTTTVARFDKEASARIHSARLELIKIARVGTHQQETEWTCSAACLRAALMHIGYDLPEADLAAVIGASQNRGAETSEIVAAAQNLGLESWEQSFPSLVEAKECLKKGIPIIADIQSFNNPGKGHYVLLSGFTEQGFMMMDPNTKGKTALPNWRIIPEEKLEEIWWDRAMAAPHQLMPKWGVMVTEPLSKEAATFAISMVDELTKLGMDAESLKAMIMGAKALGVIGAGIGFVKGSDPGADGGGPSGPISGAVTGAIKGAIIGALIALGIHRNGTTGTTIPRFF